ncbi:MAG: hypothetical protein KDA80_11905 [Planctomycetaceae bacterium]|nr:hypothetical protein [Planctomycetaceae bacterium]
MTAKSAIALCALLAVASGCQTMNTGQTASFTNSDEDPWVHEAGTIARNELEREEINDPLGLRNIFTSSKAREIERNLGVGE